MNSSTSAKLGTARFEIPLFCHTESIFHPNVHLCVVVGHFRSQEQLLTQKFACTRIGGWNQSFFSVHNDNETTWMYVKGRSGEGATAPAIRRCCLTSLRLVDLDYGVLNEQFLYLHRSFSKVGKVGVLLSRCLQVAPCLRILIPEPC